MFSQLELTDKGMILPKLDCSGDVTGRFTSNIFSLEVLAGRTDSGFPKTFLKGYFLAAYALNISK